MLDVIRDQRFFFKILYILVVVIAIIAMHFRSYAVVVEWGGWRFEMY